MPNLPLDAYRQIVPQAWQGRPHHISVEALYSALTAHEEGDFSQSGLLGRLLLRDDRIASCLETRVNALLGCKEEVEGAEIEDDVEEEKIRDEASAWFPKVATESVRRSLESDKNVYGVAFGEVIYRRSARIWTPIAIKNWDVDSFRWSDWEDCYIVQTQSGQQQVRHGDGRWIVYEPYGARSWRNGFLLSLADKWLMRQWTWRDWARFTEKLGQGVFKAGIPSGAKPEDKTKFLGQVQRIGANGAVVLPQGDTPGASYSLDLLMPDGKGFDNFDKFGTALNTTIAVRILGQNLTTEVQGGSFAAANVQDRVRGDLLEWDAQCESTTLHTGLLMPWCVANYGDPDLAPWTCRETDPPEDEKARAETRKTKVDTLTAAAALSPRVDIDHELEELGFDLLDESQVPEPPPPPAPPVPPPVPADPAVPPAEDAGQLSIEGAPVIKLATQDASSFLVSGQKWIDGVVAGATLLAQPDVDKTVDDIVKAARASTGYEDFRQRLIVLASEAPTKEAEDLFERAILLAVGQGTYSASLEIDAGT